MDHWMFPVGTKLWKEFQFADSQNRFHRVETRYMTKRSDGSWELATYLWNVDESEAQLAPEDGVSDYYDMGHGVMHDIPANFQCNACHSRGGDPVLGFDALQLATQSVGQDWNLSRLVADHVLTQPPSTTPAIQSSDVLTRNTLGYLHSNCGSCHNPSGAAKFTGMYLRHEGSPVHENDEPAIATTINQIANFWIPGTAPPNMRIIPRDPDTSVLFYRFQTTTADRMPPMGTKIVDRSEVALLRQWISELTIR
jgi:mono/diheme cytochrome c family protein